MAIETSQPMLRIEIVAGCFWYPYKTHNSLRRQNVEYRTVTAGRAYSSNCWVLNGQPFRKLSKFTLLVKQLYLDGWDMQNGAKIKIAHNFIQTLLRRERFSRPGYKTGNISKMYPVQAAVGFQHHC
jgi:hypothetical protein